MSKTNVVAVKTPTNEQMLRRSVMAHLLWEDSFYEDGKSAAARIAELIPKCQPVEVYKLAVESRNSMKLRHMPLFLAREMVRHATHKWLVSSLLYEIIQRPDELSEFLALYWKDGKCPLASQVKKGLAKAFTKFNEYSLAKYNKTDMQIKLRDVLFLCHAKPKDNDQAVLWQKLIDGKLETPDTWEVALSSGADKKATWERLLGEDKLGPMALLRNLRNMQQAGVELSKIATNLRAMNVQRVLPYRFIAAAKFAPSLESELQLAMFKSLEGMNKLPGTTVVLVDVSGSMNHPISGKSDLTRIDAANGLAILARELCDTVRVFTFSKLLVEVPDRRGFALRDAIETSQAHDATLLRAAVSAVNKNVPYDRIIVITDEQSQDGVASPIDGTKAYIINVAAYKNGLEHGAWDKISGWSEAVLTYIQEVESCSQ